MIEDTIFFAAIMYVTKIKYGTIRSFTCYVFTTQNGTTKAAVSKHSE